MELISHILNIPFLGGGLVASPPGEVVAIQVLVELRSQAAVALVQDLLVLSNQGYLTVFSCELPKHNVLTHLISSAVLV